MAEVLATSFEGLDLVEGIAHVWARGPGGEEFALRPDAGYLSPGVGRLAVAVAATRAAAQGGLDLGERITLPRGRDLGDRGVLGTLGAGLRPTWRDMVVLMLTLEDAEATARLVDRLGDAAMADAARALGLDERALAAFPEGPPCVTARQAGAAALALVDALGPAGEALVRPLLHGVRYRWRVRTRLAEDWEVATQGSRGVGTVEDVVLWRTAAGPAAAAVALTEVDDPWRAEYAMGASFRDLVEAVGAPAPASSDGEGGR